MGLFCLLAGWRGVVLAVFLCLCVVFSDVVVIGGEAGDVSYGGVV